MELKTVVHLKEVSWRKNGSLILKKINWTVHSGEHWAIVGLNGSGKTSLLNMLNGYIFPSTGKVIVLDNRFGSCDLRNLRKLIGWVSSSLQENLYVNENVMDIVLSGKYASIGLYDSVGKKDKLRASILLEQFECSHLLKRRYFMLSQGEKQKVLLARGLMSSPELLILDEPCNGLDLFARENFLSLVGQLGREEAGPTLLYVTYHLEEILPIFTYSLLMRDGTVHAAGKTVDILSESRLSDFFDHPVHFEWRGARPRIGIVKHL